VMTVEKNAVLVAVGGDDADAGAIAYGVREARRRDAELFLVHAVPTHLALTPMAAMSVMELREVGHDVLRQAGYLVKELAGDVAVRAELWQGSAVREVAEAAEQAQLVVVGRAEHAGGGAPWPGRTATGLATHCHVPVAVVPVGFGSPGEQPARVVVGVGPEPLDPEGLGEALADLARTGARIRAVHAWSVPDPYLDLAARRLEDHAWEEEAAVAVDHLLGTVLAGRPEVDVERVVSHGPAAQVLLDAAAGADLLVLPRRRHLLMAHGHLGSTAREVLSRSTVPVLVLPARA